MSRTRVLALGLLLPLVLAGMVAARRPAWSDAELEQIRSLWIGTLEAAPADASNRYADDARAAAFGEQLFNDVRLSSNGAVSCATCHVAERDFQDDRALAEGVGRTDRRTMPIAGTQYSPFLFWDGRKDSQWAQALGPLESAVEHGGDRTLYAHVIAAHYRQEYESLFGPLPELSELPRRAGPVADSAAAAAWAALTSQQQEAVTGVFVNLGKAIAAFERRIVPAPAAFDAYVRSLVEGGDDEDALSADAIAGLRLFTGKAQCSNCHNGPLLTDDHFHNTGVAPVAGLPEDRGRARGARPVGRDREEPAGQSPCRSPSEIRRSQGRRSEGILLPAFERRGRRERRIWPAWQGANVCGQGVCASGCQRRSSSANPADRKRWDTSTACPRVICPAIHSSQTWRSAPIAAAPPAMVMARGWPAGASRPLSSPARRARTAIAWATTPGSPEPHGSRISSR